MNYNILRIYPCVVMISIIYIIVIIMTIVKYLIIFYLNKR